MAEVVALPPVGVKHFQSPSLPELRFEWHPRTRKLYVIRVGSNPEIGELLALTGDEGKAEGLVSVFLKGYREGKLRRSAVRLID